MGFTKINYNNSSNRVFLDRHDILSSIEEDVRKYNEKDNFFMLYTFYGMGGIGKSQLINKIKNNYQDGKCLVYHIPLEILNTETIPAILLHIRKEFDYTPHFDYALFKYWDYISCDRVDRDSLYTISQKIIAKIGKIIDAKVLNGMINIEALVKTLITKYEEKEISDEEKEKVSNLLQDKIEKLYIHLTETLAKDIENDISNQKFIFLFDAYDIGRSSYKFDWLKYFINTFRNGIFFVTSRECLKWFDNSQVDNNVIKNYSLECIPDDEVIEYLTNHGYTEKQIAFIIKNSECIPLYLDLALQCNKQDIFKESMHISLNSKEDLVRNFLSHLNNEEQIIIEYLAVVRLFNSTIYENAIKFNYFPILRYSFSDFKKSTIIRYAEKYNELYKIHSVLAKNIACFVDGSKRATIVDNYLTAIHTRVLPDVCLNDDAKYTLSINVYKLMELEKIIISEQQAEKLIDIFFYFLDRGYGYDFYNYIESTKNKQKSELRDIYEYILGKISRGSNITVGLKRLQSIHLSSCKFGKHKKSLTCDINYILSISGDYSEAEKKMNEFAESLTEMEKNESYYIKGMVYNLDMMMLRGKFKTAVMEFELLANDVVDGKMNFEIQKAIGHCYRFNFLYDLAMLHYNQKGESLYNMSYYYTVCCETYCYFDSQKVFELYTEARDENLKYNNHNNLGKIYYSMAIAYILEHNISKAKKFISKAYTEFNNTKYHAGKLFVMLAEVYLEFCETKDISNSTITKINNLINSLDNIYKYLTLPIYIIKKDENMINQFRLSYEWFDFDKTLKNIRLFLAKL